MRFRFGFADGRSLRWLMAFAVFWGALFGVSLVHAAETQSLEIITKSGVQVFAVEVMRTDEERAKGLMFRKELPEGRGMLFDFTPEQNVSMWMKNTLIPLDMIFIQADGQILRIAENTQVESEKIISSGGPVRGVLEVIAGTSRKFGIKAGDRVGHPLFNGK